MKLLTLNCHSWLENNQIEKIEYLAKVIVEKKYDVIALQEVSQSFNKNFKENNLREDNYALILREKIKALGGDFYNLIWDYSHIGYGKYEEGLCILSKHKIKDSESFYISKSHSKENWKSRKIVKASIEIKGEVLDFYSCHLGWWKDCEEKFEFQVDNLILKLKESKNRAFLMGDFNNNAFLRGEGYDLLKEKGLFDTFDLAEKRDSGVTVDKGIDGWEKNKEPLRIDIVFTNKSTKVYESKVIFNGKNRDVVSDHFALEVYLR